MTGAMTGAMTWAMTTEDYAQFSELNHTEQESLIDKLKFFATLNQNR